MNVWLTNLPFFSAKELACRCCGLIQMDMEFAAMLPSLRVQWGKPMLLSSVCRCPKNNENEGGHPNSLHLITNPKWKTTGSMAADIAWRNWPDDDKLAFARMAHSMGFRVGLHNGFCHIDLGRKLGISPMPFVYIGWNGSFGPEQIL